MTTVRNIALAALFLFSTPLAGETYDDGIPFDYIQGHAPDKSGSSFSLMTWNVCAMPGKYPLMYGGVRASDDRIDEIANFIIQSDADIVCLQEAFDISFSYKLLDKLKHHYAYFVLDIGRTTFYQMNSGLFVATKFRLDGLDFHLFEFDNLGFQKTLRKGIFSFKVLSEGAPIAYMITTHLQPYKTDKDAFVRYQELQLAREKLSKNILNETNHYPHIICGDLNVDRFEKEVSYEIIKNHIDTLHHKKGTKIPTTATNYLTYYKNTENPVSPSEYTGEPDESIDYCLVAPHFTGTITTSHLLPAYNLEKPEMALSDHHAVWTHFQLDTQDKQDRQDK